MWMPEERLIQEAIDAVRSEAHGKSKPEIREMLVAELQSRGVTRPPDSFLDFLVDVISAGRNPISKAHNAFHGIKMLASEVVESIAEIRNIFATAEPIPHPSGRNVYFAETEQRIGPVEVLLDPEAEQFFASSGEQDMPHPLPDPLPAWLEVIDDDVTVHVRSRKVGVLRDEDAPRFFSLLGEAQRQNMVLGAMAFYHMEADGRWKLDVSVPQIHFPPHSHRPS